MSQGSVHDVVVVGGGPGGYAVAFRAAARGLDVALVESAEIGGTCLNRGCIPSKSLLHVAGVVSELGHADRFGLDVEVPALDGARLDEFRSGVITRLRRGLTGLVEQRTTLHRGTGRLREPGVVAVTDPDGASTDVRGRHVVLATGSVPRDLPGVQVDGEVVQTSDQALWFTTPPRRAVIVGAGAIGMEFASMWAPLQTQVSVVEAADRVLPLEDPDASVALTRAYRRRGIEVLTGAKVAGVEVDQGAARVALEAEDGARELEADLVLVAIGRGPRTADTGASELGILDDGGYVRTDPYGATDVEGVWAVGDVRPTLALAHAAFVEGFVVADRIAGIDGVRPVDHVHTPRVTYCHPEVASVGLTEPQARQLHDDVVVATTSMRGNAKGILHDSDGFAKVIARAGHDGETLGVHVVGPAATDLIGEAALATSWGALPGEVAAVAHAHPSLYELIGEAFLVAAGTPFHAH